jgi:2-polyprenyl-3-methyl-5-hydroxy-6-metoxy-1,4-benzoquinol methylase
LNTVEPEGCKALDFYCGTGLLADRVARQASSVVAIDPTREMNMEFIKTYAQEIFALVVLLVTWLLGNSSNRVLQQTNKSVVFFGVRLLSSAELNRWVLLEVGP